MSMEVDSVRRRSGRKNFHFSWFTMAKPTFLHATNEATADAIEAGVCGI